MGRTSFEVVLIPQTCLYIQLKVLFIDMGSMPIEVLLAWCKALLLPFAHVSAGPVSMLSQCDRLTRSFYARCMISQGWRIVDGYSSAAM